MARRRISPRPSHWSTAASGCAGSPATRRSATESRRSCRRGSATQRRSRSSSPEPHSPTNAASSSPMRRRPASPRELAVGGRLRQDALLAELLDLGYLPVAEVAGRGEFARRGGIVDVFPPSAPLPVRIEFFGDEIDSLRAFDPTDQRAVGPLAETLLLPASEFLHRPGGLEDRLGRKAAKLPERLAADLGRFGAAGPSRAMNVGDAAEVWAPLLAP